MNERLKNESLFKNDQGVALTEFCIVIPIVLLFFFAILQFYEIVLTAQLSNYAAYVAARSYSVRAKADQAPDSFSADNAAEFSAAMALAPVAKTGGFGGGGVGGLGGGLGQLADGFAMAYSQLAGLGGSFSTSVEDVGSHHQAVVKIAFPQPINVPGLKEMWNFVAGSDINTSLLPLENGTGFALGIMSGTPAINIPSQCSTGCEEWSGVIQQPNSSPDKWQ